MKSWLRYALGFAMCAATACAGKTGGDASAISSNASGGTPATGGSSAGATYLGGTYNVSSTTGGSPTVGAGSTGGATATFDPRFSAWWGTDCGPAVCIPGSCGTIVDYCGNLIDCGFANCPEEMCGKDGWNLCPAACSTKLTCQSAGNKNCGFISDGCSSIVDCGTCPEGQCCGCISLTSNADPAAPVPNVCVSDPIGSIPQACDTGDCGLKPDYPGIIDCGPCCEPRTCEDACPLDTSGIKRSCVSSQESYEKRYILQCYQPDGCNGVISCWCLLG